MTFSARCAQRKYRGLDYHFLPLNGVLRTQISVTSLPMTWPTAICHNFFRRLEPSWQLRTRTGSYLAIPKPELIPSRSCCHRCEGAVGMDALLCGPDGYVPERGRVGWMFESGTLNYIYSPECGALSLSLRWMGCIYIRWFEWLSAKKGIYTRPLSR